MLFQPVRNAKRRGGLPLHTQRQRLDAAQRQKGIERPLDAADGVLQKAEALAQLRIVADDRDAADHVGMAVEIFGGRMHDEIEAVFERALQIRTGKSIIGERSGFSSRAMSATRFRSTILSSGLVGVSTQISRVFGRIAAVSASGSDRST